MSTFTTLKHKNMTKTHRDKFSNIPKSKPLLEQTRRKSREDPNTQSRHPTRLQLGNKRKTSWKIHGRAINTDLSVSTWKDNVAVAEKLSNGNLHANFANVASTCGRVCGTFCVDVVTRQTRRHLPSRVVQTPQHLPSRVARTRQTRERWVWQVLCKFSKSGKSGKFGECRLDHFMHIKYVICS